MTGTAAYPASQVAAKLCELADEHYGNSVLNTALLLGQTLSTSSVKDLVAGHCKILVAMHVNDRALFKAGFHS